MKDWTEQEIEGLRSRLREGIRAANEMLDLGTVAEAYIAHRAIFMQLDRQVVLSVAATAIVELALRERGQ